MAFCSTPPGGQPTSPPSAWMQPTSTRCSKTGRTLRAYLTTPTESPAAQRTVRSLPAAIYSTCPARPCRTLPSGNLCRCPATGSAGRRASRAAVRWQLGLPNFGADAAGCQSSRSAGSLWHHEPLRRRCKAAVAKWSVTAFCNNVFNKIYYQDVEDFWSALSNTSTVIARPSARCAAILRAAAQCEFLDDSGVHQAVAPPSMEKSAPVTQPASSEAR